ncbi:two component transcriptional regulator, LytTR family [Chitinophaga sp. YR573]|uniref:LytR/AlgR family response regulator transcription factor n=1 Tax=Chitinophaga sp. YR573 TaxID=1881040 RepID=UPI0008D342E8|nr:LytTR family DNA-binding domain-containing protein [Chitinophaga sp. YR573]SEW10572.1 two component transcriptional regulator, LytTR family [Chitinophaga sp. YR573]
MRTIIVDDEKLSRSVLTLLLEKHCPAVNIVAVCADGITALEAIEAHKPELLFLDVEMPGLNGFEVLQACKDASFSIIITTSHDHYALDAIRHNALDYLMKPIIREDLQEAVDKAQVRLSKMKGQTVSKTDSLMEFLHQHLHPGERLALPSPEGLRMLLVKDIMYCVADGENTKIYLQNSPEQPSLVCRTLKEVESNLKNKGFFRVHHSYVVNLFYMDRYIKGDGGDIIMSDGSSIPVSRNRKQEFMERIERL